MLCLLVFVGGSVRVFVQVIGQIVTKSTFSLLGGDQSLWRHLAMRRVSCPELHSGPCSIEPLLVLCSCASRVTVSLQACVDDLLQSKGQPFKQYLAIPLQT